MMLKLVKNNLEGHLRDKEPLLYLTEASTLYIIITILYYIITSDESQQK